MGLREGHGSGELRGRYGRTGLVRLRHLTELLDDASLLALDATPIVPAHVREQREDGGEDGLWTHAGRYAREVSS